jgi:ABC-type transport system involved in multi-copper enzyme maturation permease subunit
MVGVIAKREILESLKSAKFLIGLLVALAIGAAATVINAQDYKQRQGDFAAAREELKGNKFDVQIYRPPEVLSILVQGKDRVLGSRASVNYLSIPDRLSGFATGGTAERQRSLSGFGSVDFSFLVRVVLSLMIVFLAYNAVAEEKANGTLKLSLANAVPRHHILLGKLAAGLVVALGSLLAAAAVSLFILLVQPSVRITGGDWSRIGGLLLVSAAYLSVFYALSLLVSTLVRRPPIALLVLLQLWIFLVVIYPHLGVDIAERAYRLPTDRELAQMRQSALGADQAEFKRVRDAFLGGDRSNETYARYVELQAQNSRAEYEVNRDFGRRLSGQLSLANALCVLSPAALYDRAAERYARTGIDAYDRFMASLARYWETKYLDLQRLRFKDMAAFRAAPIPSFDDPPEPAANAWAGTMPRLLILILMGIALFAASTTAFLKKDVR